MPTSMRLDSKGWRWGLSFGIPIAAGFWALIELARLRGDDDVERFPWWALLLAAVGALLVLGVLELVGTHGPANRSQYGWLAIAIGADGRMSTSKTQVLLWTVTLSVAMIYLTGIVAFGPAEAGDVFDSVSWEQYFVLLGGPFAAGVLAKLTMVTKVQSGTVQSTITPAASEQLLAANGATETAPAAADPARPKGADVVSNNNGEIDIVDTQYLVFNLVALVYFFVAYVSEIVDRSAITRFALPDIPGVLLGLTSLAAGTYVANKATQRSAPRIVTVNPQPVVANATVDVLGVSLVPPGETPETAAVATSVMVRDLAAADAPSAVLGVADGPNAAKVSFTMPLVFAGKDVDIRVVTAGAVATAPYRVTVAAAP